MAAITATQKPRTSQATASVWRRLQHGWLELAAHFGEVQTLLIVCVVYVFVLGPMALVARLTGRDLLAKRGFTAAASAWCDSDTVTKPDLERAKRLF